MHFAVIGSGVAGLTAAYLLAQRHRVTLFEADSRLGGHTNTLRVQGLDIDTGFIVCNDRTYPNFLKLLARVGVPTQPSVMSFSMQCQRTGLEYNGGSFAGLFAQRRNLLRPRFYKLLLEILRFNRTAPLLLDLPGEGPTLGEFLAVGNYRQEFVDLYLLPMAMAIWSAPHEAMAQFPAKYLVRFFQNHGLLNAFDRPQWLTVAGGSYRYIDKLIEPFREGVRLGAEVESIRRDGEGVYVKARGHEAERFDAVVIAAHADQALTMLADPTPAERDILGAFAFQANEAVLHTDTSLLPRNRRAWASWNYFVPNVPSASATVTYNMNILQSLKSAETFCVTLNRTADVDPKKILRKLTYHHPLYNRAAVAAQPRWREINGPRTYYCGAYWGFGFHEDGVKSALAVAETQGISL